MMRILLAIGAMLATIAVNDAQAQATQIQAVSGVRFAVHPGSTSSQFVVQALDSRGVGVPNAPITFTVQGGCGSWLGGTSTSGFADSQGFAAAPFTAGSSSGLCPVTAGLTGTSVFIAAAFRIFTAADIQLTFIPGQSFTTQTNQPFTVGVRTFLDNDPLFGAFVTFTPPSSGAGVSTITTPMFTDATGTALASAMANGTAGNYSIGIGVEGGTTAVNVTQQASTLPPAPPLVQDMWWSSSENGWGMSIVQHDDKLFCVIYAYDASGKPTWYVLPAGSWDAARKVFTGALYSPSGSPYFSYQASKFVANDSVGTMTLDFTLGTSIAMSYTINGASGTKTLTRQSFGGAVASPVSGVGDMWWGGISQNGWGIAVLQQYASFFSVWFTYDANGAPTWYVMPSGTWTSATTYEGRMYRTTSSPWVGRTYNPSQLNVVDVGPFKLRIIDANTAALDWTVDDHAGTLSLTRQAF